MAEISVGVGCRPVQLIAGEWENPFPGGTAGGIMSPQAWYVKRCQGLRCFTRESGVLCPYES